jgi:hypothetical protein
LRRRHDTATTSFATLAAERVRVRVRELVPERELVLVLVAVLG